MVKQKNTPDDWRVLADRDMSVVIENESKRKIGMLEGKAHIEFTDDFSMTTEELCELK